jgi:hypothetical protein
MAAVHPPLELSHFDYGEVDVTAPTWPASAPPLVPPEWRRPSAAQPSTPIVTAPQTESAPERYVAIPAAEIAKIEAEQSSAERTSPPTSGSTPAAPLDPSFLFPTPPPKRRKKKRPAGFAEPVEEPLEGEPIAEHEPVEVAPLEVSAEEEAHEPEPPVVEQRELVLPDEFLIVPLPNLTDWSGEEVSIASLPRVLPRDFARIYRPPTGRMLPSRVRVPAAKKSVGAEPTAQSTTIDRELAKDPAYRARLRNEHRDAVIASAAAEHGVPVDQVEIISIRQWDEETETKTETQIITHITTWTEITFRVRSNSPRELIASVAFPVRL